MLQCPECGTAMRLVRGHWGLFWRCPQWPECTGTHGAHADGRPLGVPGNAETKQWRVKAHEAFDRLWRNQSPKRGRRGRARKKAYRWMQKTLNLAEDDAHIGRFDVGQCQALIAAVNRRLGPPEKT